MGAWGTDLFDSDFAKDIRGDYIDKLRAGKSPEEASCEMIAENRYTYEEDEAVFWISLAAVQWEYGRLQPDVKEKALDLFKASIESERWKEAGEKKEAEWKEALYQWKEKIGCEQPPPKRIHRAKAYICPWEPGSVYAYRLKGEYSKEKGFYDQFFLFRKVSAGKWYPNHTIPVVEIFNWIGKEIPSLGEIRGFDVMPNPFSSVGKDNTQRFYRFELVFESTAKVPIEQLTFLGVIPGDDLSSCSEGFLNYVYPISPENCKANWKIEKTVIDQFIKWNIWQSTRNDGDGA